MNRISSEKNNTKGSLQAQPSTKGITGHTAFQIPHGTNGQQRQNLLAESGIQIYQSNRKGMAHTRSSRTYVYAGGVRYIPTCSYPFPHPIRPSRSII